MKLRKLHLLLVGMVWFNLELGAFQRPELLDSCWSILQQALLKGNPGERERAAWALAKVDSARATALLKATAEDPTSPARHTALRVVLPRLDKSLASKLLNQSLQDTDLLVRVRALEALGDLKGETSLELIEASLRQQERVLTEVAFGVLAKFGKESIAVLARQLRDGSELNRQRSVRLIQLLGDRSAVPALRNAISDQSPIVRFAAAKTLASFGDPAGSAELYAVAKGQDRLSSLEAIVSLYSLGLPVEIQRLQSALADKNPTNRTEVVRMFKNVPRQLSIPILANALKDSAPSVRAAAMEVLASSATQDELPLLQRGLDSDDDWVRILAAEIIQKLGKGSPSLVDIVNRPLKGQDVILRERAVQLLIRIGSPQAVQRLQETLQDRDPMVQTAAINGLAELGDKSAVGVIERVLNSDNKPEVIAAAADALVDLREAPSSFEPLLKSENNYTRIYAASSILRLQNLVQRPSAK